jgi:NADH dehydrogenase
MNVKFDVVTGATSYTGKYITRKLLADGHRVKTLTGHPNRVDEFGNKVGPLPFNFDKPEELTKSLVGADVFYNTYWVRFPHGKLNFNSAVENTKILMRAAKDARVKKFVHVSIANPDENSPLAYYKGKGVLEKYLIELGLPYAILRPTVIFGREDILINNIAWFLRRFPIFGIPGDGKYRIQPIFVEDMADLAIQCARTPGNIAVDAVGPEIYSFQEIVQLIANKIGSKAKIISVPWWLAWIATSAIGYFTGDIILTKEEIDGLMADLLTSKESPIGKTSFSRWLEENSAALGRNYSSELKRHFRHKL